MRHPFAPLAFLPLAAALAAAGCTNARTLPAYRRAVVVFAPSRAADAETARTLLAADGWNVDAVVQGPARRSRSSVAVYDARKFPKLGEHVADVLEPMRGAPSVEVLPFAQGGPAGTSVVLWLADLPHE